MAVNEHRSAGDPQTPEEARLSALYRQAARETPPADLDSRIAAAARGGAWTTSGGRLLSWLNTFRVPLATAAVLVVSASLVITMREEHENRVVTLPGAQPSAPAEAAPVPQTSIPGEPAPVPETGAARPAAQVERNAERQREVTSGDRAHEAPKRRAPSPPSERELRKEHSGIAYGKYMKSSPTNPSAGDKGENLEPRASPSSVEQQAPTAARAPVAAPPADHAAASPPPAPEPKVLSEAVPGSIPAPAGPGALGALRRAPPREFMRSPSPQAQATEPVPPVAAAEARGERTREERRVALERLQALNLPPPDISALVAALEVRPPAAWLDRVRLLQREGLLLEADRLLAEFKRRFPEEPVPSDVQ